MGVTSVLGCPVQVSSNVLDLVCWELIWFGGDEFGWSPTKLAGCLVRMERDQLAGDLEVRLAGRGKGTLGPRPFSLVLLAVAPLDNRGGPRYFLGT